MKNKMRLLSKLIPLSIFAFPLLVSAQGSGSLSFVNSGSLWIAVVVGLVASLMVLTYAQKIGGGVLQKVYYSFGFGMLLVVFGFLSVVIKPWAEDYIIKGVHDILFVLGMALMVFGAGKLLEVVD